MRLLKRFPVLIGVIGTVAVGSMLAAGDDSQLPVPDPAPIVSESVLPADAEPAVDPDPNPNPELAPEGSPDLDPPAPVPTSAPAPSPDLLPLPIPDPEPTFEYVEGVPWVPGAPIDGEIRDPYEGEPMFDCRWHGNRECGVVIQGEWYVVAFDAAGQPAGVRVRGF